MTRVYILCEGQTEETFVRDSLKRYFDPLNIWLTPILLRTSREGKGGVSGYQKVKTQILRLCKQDASAWVSTFINIYGLPGDFLTHYYLIKLKCFWIHLKRTLIN